MGHLRLKQFHVCKGTNTKLTHRVLAASICRLVYTTKFFTIDDETYTAAQVAVSG